MKINLLILLLFSIRLFSQDQIYVTSYLQKVHSFNLADCSSTVLVPSNGSFVDLALTPNGNLYALEASILYQINTVNGSVTQIGATNPLLFSNSLVSLNNNVLLSVGSFQLRGINISNSSTYLIGNVPYSSDGDLTWYDNDLYMASNGLLIRIVLNATNTGIVSIGPVNNLSNPIPYCEGLITAAFPGDENAIIGFSYGKVYKICHLDGTSIEICSHVLGNIAGATATRLAIQNPLPTNCPDLSSNDNFTTHNTIIYPNPIKKDGVLNIEVNSTDESPISVSIINILGVTLNKKTEIRLDKNIEVNLRELNLTSGIYFVEVLQENLKTRSIIIVE